MSSKIIRFIGDVHGKFRRYKRIICGCDRSIQVGDMGVGFIAYGGYNHGQFSANPPFDYMAKGPHEFIRGNHDSPSVCKRHKFCISDGTVRDNMMFIGGEFSIDREWRIQDYSWWADEELSNAEFMQLVDVYLATRPEIMVTHGCPAEIVAVICFAQGRRPFATPSRTSQAFQAMWEFYKPKLWIFGHHHYSFDKVMDGTRFICLNELQYAEVNTETLEVDYAEWQRRDGQSQTRNKRSSG